MRVWKIVEVVNNDIFTLFHGIEGSRKMPQHQWIKANKKMGKDGTSKTSYLTGWHVLPTLEDAQEYLLRFTQRLEKLRIVECEVRGQVRDKEHSPSPVLLADEIYFRGV
jgi:hypothetical protein